jgi:NAD(P)H-dependent FMN reductase
MPKPAGTVDSAAEGHRMKTAQPAELVVVIASVRVDRFGPTVAEWFLEQARSRVDFRVTVVDLAELALPNDLSGGAATEAFTAQIDGAQGVGVVTPEYNHGYPGGLKTAIDSLVSEWRTKPVGFVSYGGAAGGMRCVQQLKTVFTELRAVVIRESVSFTWVWDQFGEDGQLREPARANAAAQTLLDEVAWWCEVLHSERERGRLASVVVDETDTTGS